MATSNSDERVILAGHILTGLAMSHAMESYPDKSFRRSVTSIDRNFTCGKGPNKPPTLFISRM
ncbi:hypothetical protein RJ641_013716 [Dillenia turbinata]|uniref:Uncharacterized protein n=1 Tax=Dillenia turbinata TaxID=194707 RepID=A0AAN8ZQS8_9MAGN